MSKTHVTDSFGELLLRHRKRAGLNQTELANRVGVTQPVVSLWENGHSVPQRKHIQLVVDALGLDADAADDLIRIWAGWTA